MLTERSSCACACQCFVSMWLVRKSSGEPVYFQCAVLPLEDYPMSRPVAYDASAPRPAIEQEQQVRSERMMMTMMRRRGRRRRRRMLITMLVIIDHLGYIPFVVVRSSGLAVPHHLFGWTGPRHLVIRVLLACHLVIT
jgi:predicted nucleic acid-binding Zn ribbon protein